MRRDDLTVIVTPYEEEVFEMNFTEETNEETNVKSSGKDLNDFKDKMKSAGWETDKALVVQNIPGETATKWKWEIYDGIHPIDEGVAFFSKEEATTEGEMALDFIMRNEPKTIKVFVWPETGQWCHEKDIELRTSLGANDKYVPFETTVAMVWDRSSQKAQPEADQDYYINIEVDEFIRSNKLQDRVELQNIAISSISGGDLRDAVKFLSSSSKNIPKIK